MSNTAYAIENGEVIAIPAERLETARREAIIERGRQRYAATEPPIYMCGWCRSVQIEPEKGLCPKCENLKDMPLPEMYVGEPHEVEHTPGYVVGFTVVGLIFLIVYVAFEGLRR
jgi:hypothetical protein